MNRNPKVILFGILTFLLIAMIGGCTKQYDYATDEPFVITSSYMGGANHYLQSYPVHISIEEDGTLLLYTIEGNSFTLGRDAPVIKMQLDESQVNEVKHLIEENNFWKLPKDLSTPAEDGGSNYVLVNLTDQSKEVGGEIPNNPRYLEILKYITNLVDDADYEQWKKDIEEHLWEEDALHANKKTDYNMDKPFLVLSMEHLFDENYTNVYRQNISIDINGNITLFADIEESKLEIGDDAPQLKIEITDNELEKIQELIQQHFWKLNEFIRNPDGGDLIASITVNLTEESQTVLGHDPNHERFIAIRDEMIQLIDEVDYMNWVKDVETHIRGANANQ